MPADPILAATSSPSISFFFLLRRRPPRSTLFPSPTLFRSHMKRKPELRIVVSNAPPPAAHAEAPPEQVEMPFAMVNGEPVTQLPHDLYIPPQALEVFLEDRKSTRLNSSHSQISYAVFCLKK